MMDELGAFESEWVDFCDELRAALVDAGRSIVRDSADVLDRDEGLRMVLRQVRHSLERELEERDATHPTLGPVFTDTYHTLADAPDYAAYDALISGKYRYRLSGRLGDADSINFTTMAPRPAGDGSVRALSDGRPWPGAGGADNPSAGRVATGTLELADLEPDGSGRFDVVLSVTQPAAGVWLPMMPETNRLVVRNVYNAAFRDHRRRNPAQLWLECEGVAQRPDPYSTEDLRTGLRSVLNGVERVPTSRAPIFQRIRTTANGAFSNDVSFWKGIGANPRTHFDEAYWEIEPDQALVIEVDRLPACSSWSVGLTNAWMESLDFRFFSMNLNNTTAVYESDASLRIVVAHTDPGSPNWLDVAGHRHGAMLWRWNDVASAPALPRMCLVDLAAAQAAHAARVEG
jgi:hypothetical protein